MNMDYSVIIPVYNSSRSLPELAARIDAQLGGKESSGFEIIMVDDASPDESSWETIKTLAARYPFLKGYRLLRNEGKNGALICGMDHAKGDYLILMDDDLQHRPEDFPVLIKEGEHDLVIARFPENRNGRVKDWLSRMKGKLDERFAGKPEGLRFGPFMMMKKEIANELCKLRTPFPYLPAMLFSLTRDAVNVSVPHDKRRHGRSQFTLYKMLKLMSNLLINNTSVMLRTVSVAGIAFSILSFLLALYFLYKKIFVGIHVAGWATLVILVLLIGGITLFSLGIIGEYLLRIIKALEHRSAYVIREETA